MLFRSQRTFVTFTRGNEGDEGNSVSNYGMVFVAMPFFFIQMLRIYMVRALKACFTILTALESSLFASLSARPYIYYLEKNIEYGNKVKEFLMSTYNLGKEFVTSAITIEEYSIVPYRENNTKLLKDFDKLIEDTETVIVDITKSTAIKAARIRADYKNFKAIDALQLAAARNSLQPYPSALSHLLFPFFFPKACQDKIISHNNRPLHKHTVLGKKLILLLLAHTRELILKPHTLI